MFANAAYRKFLARVAGAEPEILEGRLLRDLRPGARLPEVIRDGQAHPAAPRREAEDIFFVNMYPVFEKGEVVAGLSVVTLSSRPTTSGPS